MEQSNLSPQLPRVSIRFCTQCRWMLRAAYFGQELLSTFSTAIGEVALIPVTGGIFQVHLTYLPQSADSESGEPIPKEVLLWDRKTEGGFPETKILKQRLRDHIEPGKNLGHSDKPSRKPKGLVDSTDQQAAAQPTIASPPTSSECADCR
ncbi:hypothetical protein K461DRAFT_82339 [Myriangium duriaei CBS 260.36]|uniref:Selenoprotein W-like protein n=1 Tax=Myriangium duriaei CBS 260.36 TaxID=1168546 RepID=A0A9P4MID1_9PEZI|nr:hypothetical protein K461DRAFT_82339 [Myriangium duriaei CBS 260.36]